jgi:uncharacterized protein with FMN-binding domain
MRRAVLTLGCTAAGLAALLMLKTHSAAATPPAAGTPVTPAAPAAASPTLARSGASATARTVSGSVATTPYGPMQVRLTLDGQRITKVAVVRRTDDGTESQQIDSFAIPKLTGETIAAQGARIDAVSGASYTSSGYIQSLQSALDQASA